jgi:hypothetical protein
MLVSGIGVEVSYLDLDAPGHTRSGGVGDEVISAISLTPCVESISPRLDCTCSYTQMLHLALLGVFAFTLFRATEIPGEI